MTLVFGELRFGETGFGEMGHNRQLDVDSFRSDLQLSALVTDPSSNVDDFFSR